MKALPDVNMKIRDNEKQQEISERNSKVSECPDKDFITKDSSAGFTFPGFHLS